MRTDEVSGATVVTSEYGRRLADLMVRERQRGCPSLSGTRAEIAVPVRQVLVDRLVAKALERARDTDVRIDILEGARLAVAVSHRIFGIPARARTVLTIERVVTLRPPHVVLRYDESLLWKTIRAVVAPLGLLPPGVSFAERAVLVDLEALAARGGWSDVLHWLTRLEIHGPADGLLVIEAEAEISRKNAEGVPVQAGSHASGPPAVRFEDVLDGVAGARARAEIHVAEGLVNDALAEVRAILAQPMTAREPRAERAWWMSWVRELAVRFDRGRMVILTDVEVPGRAEGSRRESGIPSSAE
jgi:hypothetical protein